MEASKKQFCCTHPQQRIDSPEPPPRLLASMDDIFAAAALPEDHPHALQFKDLKEKKPELDASIVRSPGFADKLKMQWRKKSVRSLSKDKEYDEDAKAITSQEVLVELDTVPTSERSCSDGIRRQGELEYAASLDLEQARYASACESKAEIRSSVLGSAEYLRPFLEKPSTITVSGQCHRIVDVATRVATQRVFEDVTREKESPPPPLPKSLSSPLLLPWTASSVAAPARRTKSEICLDEALKIPKHRTAATSETEIFKGLHRDHGGELDRSRVVRMPSLHVQEPTWAEQRAAAQEMILDRDHNDTRKSREEPSLYAMGISHQLRSMSQLSDPVEEDVGTISSNPWNFHHRERSGVGFESSARDRYSRIKSSTGMDSSTVPSAWGRVHSPAAASSIYSRPTSAGPNAADANDHKRGPDRPPYSMAIGMDALFADWPLRPSASSDGSASKSRGREKPLPPVPADGRELHVTTEDKDDTGITWLSPPRDASAAPRTSSSSVISGLSKRSKFMERFSPPKRTVRKRRSIFKFLRPGSRKQQTRSISTPILNTKSPSAPYDGPADDPALLTVQYELAEQPQHTMRSASMNQLSPTRQSTSTNQLLSLHSLQRQPTLAEFERNLSVVGDDRRRPSSMNLTRLNEIKEEDRRESFGIRRKLSRAKELRDDVSPLMAQALTKHQLEKDAFRSSSKRRSTASVDRPTPVFAQSTFATSSSLAPTPEDQSELLDPLEKIADPADRANSSNYLSPLDAAGPSRGPSTATGASTTATASSLPQLRGVRAGSSIPRQRKIGTSLASWSRYPSHTRFERCGSAGRVDNIVTRDFAFDFDPAGVHASDDSDAGSIGPDRGVRVTPKQARKLQKSHSLTFGSIMRYYSNLFHTSGWAGQNRRTSVTVGGRLEHPELEMLPPPVSNEPHHGHATIKHLKDIVKEDADKIKEFVQEEEGKIGEYVRKEEGKIEGFVREEEEKLEKFVEQEEDKLGGLVKKEEGKLMKLVYDEEEKWKHHQEQNTTHFRHSSIFKTNGHLHDERRETMIGPNNHADEPTPEGPNALHLDGTAMGDPGLTNSGPSKAELWSDIYQQCMTRPALKEPLRSESMPPLAPKPRIRRFPSVTVIDDQKGHYRSISLVSVKTSRS